MISIVVISKDEPAVEATLRDVCRQAAAFADTTEVLVVDASDGRLDAIAGRLPIVNWMKFVRPPSVRVSIPHQRNVGVRASAGDVVVFIDAGCTPCDGWLSMLVAPIAAGHEDVVAGTTHAHGRPGLYDSASAAAANAEYLDECATINMAFRRTVFDRVGGFDEGFEYGSDLDFTWRIVEAGFRIHSVPNAAVAHDWGSPRRQVRRSYYYGKAKVRLYSKHRDRLRHLWRDDPMTVAYPLFLLGLPLTLRFRPYPLLLAIPAWRNRSNGSLRVLVDHLCFGLGVISGLLSR